MNEASGAIEGKPPGELVTVGTAAYPIQISKELLKDSGFPRPTWDLMLGLRKPTAREIASGKRYAAKQARLYAAGLLDDRGYPKKVTECPRVATLGEDEDVRCERKAGHRGLHRYVTQWDDQEARDRLWFTDKQS